jgi:hypothetical protein
MHIKAVWKKPSPKDDPGTEYLEVAGIAIGCIFDVKPLCDDTNYERSGRWEVLCRKMGSEGIEWFEIGHARTKKQAKVLVEQYLKVRED